MKLTRASEYAIRCVAFLSSIDKGVVASRARVASEMDIPSHFLAKIAQQLQKGGIITIAQGSRGGLALARPAAEITVLDVVEALMGPIGLNECVLHPGKCHRVGGCSINRVWVTATKQMRATLSSANFKTHCISP
jgi:Rrf2 family protein